MTIRIVTDSTCDIPPALAAEMGVVVVPAYINIGQNSYLDGVDLSRQQFYRSLPDYPSPPTTAPPSPSTFTEVYRSLIADGATGIVSIHLATALSGLLNAARLGAEPIGDVPIKLCDSQQVSLGLGLLVMTAAEAARAGHSMTEIMAILDDAVGRAVVFAALDTLEYLRRSGRVSWTQFGIGTLLRIKPLIKVFRGEVMMLERVRTRTRAIARMINLVEECGPLQKAAILNIGSEDQLAAFVEQTAHLFPGDEPPMTAAVTPVIGAHVGPGALGIACIIGD